MNHPVRRDFRRFESALGTVVNDWEPLSEEDFTEVSMTPYHFMSEQVMDSLKRNSDLHPKLLNDNALHGATTIARYCHVAALIANREGMARDDLAQLIRHPDSFGVISRIARGTSPVANFIEDEIGIRGHYREQELVSLKTDKWVVGGDGELKVPLLEGIIYTSTVKAIKYCESRKLALDLDAPHECLALSHGTLPRIRDAFFTICMRDPLLFDATLAREYEFPPITMTHIA